jgi:hypothetical protein
MYHHAAKGPPCFLEPCQSDRDLVQKIGQELRDAGLEVWDPDQNILPGANWMDELKAALDSASAFVVFIFARRHGLTFSVL